MVYLSPYYEPERESGICVIHTGLVRLDYEEWGEQFLRIHGSVMKLTINPILFQIKSQAPHVELKKQ